MSLETNIQALAQGVGTAVKATNTALTATNTAATTALTLAQGASADATTKANAAQAAAIAASAPIAHVGSNGTAHAIATTTVNGFMAAADLVRLNTVETTANTANTAANSALSGNANDSTARAAAANALTVAQAGSTGAGNSVVKNIQQTAHGFTVGNAVYLNASGVYVKAIASAASTSEVVGMVSAVTDANNFKLTTSGYISGLSGLIIGESYRLSTSVAGGIQNTAILTATDIDKPLLVADSATGGYLMILRGSVITPTVVNNQIFSNFRNRIINGSMMVNQRNASTVTITNSSTTTGPRDMWRSALVGATAGSISLKSSEFTYDGTPKKSTKLNIDTAVTLSSTGYVHGITQGIENFNCIGLNNQPIAISFLFNTNVSGTFSVSFRNINTDKSYLTTFTAVANTPKKVEILVPAISGANGIYYTGTTSLSIQLVIGLVSNNPSYISSTLNTWNLVNDKSLVSSTSTNYASTGGNFIEVAEVQLEAGTVCTPFEHRPYTTELALCQRYYEEVNSPGILALNNSHATWLFKVVKRTIPTISGVYFGAAPWSSSTHSRIDIGSYVVGGFGFNGSDYGVCAASAEL